MLTPKQQNAVKLMAEGELTQKQIAARVKVSEQTVCEWKKNEEFMAEYNRLIRLGIQSFAAKAYKNLERLMYAENENVQLMAVKDILDRAGFKPDAKVSVDANVGVAIIDDIGFESDEDDTAV